MKGNCEWCDVCLGTAVDHTAPDVLKTRVVRHTNTLNSANGIVFEDFVRGIHQNNQHNARNFNLKQIATCIRELILQDWLKEGACSNTPFGVSRGVKWGDPRVQRFLEGALPDQEIVLAVNGGGEEATKTTTTEETEEVEEEETVREEEIDAAATALVQDTSTSGY